MKVVGLLLMPLSASLLWTSAKTLAGVAVRSPTSAPFGAGLGLVFCLWAMRRWLIVDLEGPAAWAARGARWSYVFGHEFTHALAAWATGGSVFDIVVGEKEGHVDLSHSSVFVALAPYCFPFYALLVLISYRFLLWAKPDAGGESLFLFLFGGALGAHLLFTWDSLTQARQPDLDAAGGAVFSVALISIANALVLMLLLKGLFPESVPLLSRLAEAAGLTKGFWAAVWSWSKPALSAARARIAAL